MDPVHLSIAARAPRPAATPGSAPQVPFGEKIQEALATANRDLQVAENAGSELARAETDVVDTMVALGKADLSLRFVVALRNRALEAYNEIMRLQV